MDDERAAANSEIRYITVELMKLAARKKKPFAQMAHEFVSNTYTLENLIRKRLDSAAAKKSPSSKKDRI
ncbi:MAG: hypothetical protein WC506_00860 [Candidatus Micrarchaeia archaeon]